MERKICPYLGLPDDDKTTLDFPSDGNLCYRASPAEPANHEHQSRYCLTGQHAACPVFMARTAGRLPAAIAAPQTRWQRAVAELRARKELWAWKEFLASTPLDRIIFPAAVIMLLAASGLFGRTIVAGQRTSLLNPLQPAGQFALIPNTAGNQTGAGAASGLRAADPLPEPTPGKNCPIPQGWQPYNVQPTDSLYRVSILFGVSVEALQKANCLDGQTYLAPGAMLFVPALEPTATPTPTPFPTLPPVVVNHSGDSAEQPAAAPPVAVPPAAAPPAVEQPAANPNPPAQAGPSKPEKPKDKGDGGGHGGGHGGNKDKGGKGKNK